MDWEQGQAGWKHKGREIADSAIGAHKSAQVLREELTDLLAAARWGLLFLWDEAKLYKHGWSETDRDRLAAEAERQALAWLTAGFQERLAERTAGERSVG